MANATKTIVLAMTALLLGHGIHCLAAEYSHAAPANYAAGAQPLAATEQSTPENMDTRLRQTIQWIQALARQGVDVEAILPWAEAVKLRQLVMAGDCEKACPEIDRLYSHVEKLAADLPKDTGHAPPREQPSRHSQDSGGGQYGYASPPATGQPGNTAPAQQFGQYATATTLAGNGGQQNFSPTNKENMDARFKQIMTWAGVLFRQGGNVDAILPRREAETLRRLVMAGDWQQACPMIDKVYPEMEKAAGGAGQGGMPPRR